MSTLTTERPAEPKRAERPTTTPAHAAPASASAGAARATAARRPTPATPAVGLRFPGTALNGAQTAPRRGVFGLSLAIHGVVLGLAIVLSLVAGRGEPVERRVDIVFYPPVAEAPPPVPEPLPEPEPPVEIARVEPEPPPRAAEPIAPPVVREPEPARPAPRPAPVVAERRPEPRPTPVPVEPRPVVKTNLFAADEPPAAVRPAAERRAPRAAGFIVPTTEPAPRARAAVAVKAAGFGTASTVPAAVPDPAPARVVTGAAFADEAAAAPTNDPRPRAATVASTGFDTTKSAPAAPSTPRGAVQSGGFGTLVDDAPTGGGTRRAPVATLDTPVEVLSKARPVYTEAARAQRIEGEVVVQVKFRADGTLHVLQVLERLGHGLDEAAVEAVKQIEFKPARREGKAVDHTATLRVVFKLA